jgi:spore coat-associated protein N
MDTFANTSKVSPRQALRSQARALTTPRGSIGAFFVLAIVAAAAASAGAFGTFTSSTNVSHDVTSGTVVIALGATGASTNRLDVDADHVAAGDTIERSVDLTNSGNLDLASIKLTTSAVTSSKLDQDATNGLQMKIESCSAAWTETGSSAPFTYTCDSPATTQTVLIQGPVIGTDQTLSNLGSLTAGGTDHLLVTETLPASADDSFQGLTSEIDYAFTGTQRAATNR